MNGSLEFDSQAEENKSCSPHGLNTLKYICLLYRVASQLKVMFPCRTTILAIVNEFKTALYLVLKAN